MALTASELASVFPLDTRVNERGRLEIGGCDAIELVQEFGTPAYVVAEQDLRQRARSFLDALSARHRDCDVLFGSKAFPCTAVYRVLAQILIETAEDEHVRQQHVDDADHEPDQEWRARVSRAPEARDHHEEGRAGGHSEHHDA